MQPEERRPALPISSLPIARVRSVSTPRLDLPEPVSAVRIAMATCLQSCIAGNSARLPNFRLSCPVSRPWGRGKLQYTTGLASTCRANGSNFSANETEALSAQFCLPFCAQFVVNSHGMMQKCTEDTAMRSFVKAFVCCRRQSAYRNAKCAAAQAAPGCGPRCTAWVAKRSVLR